MLDDLESLEYDWLLSACDCREGETGAGFNSIWESDVPSSWKLLKPNSTSTFADRDYFIRAKYESKKFLKAWSLEEMSKSVDDALVNAIERGDVFSAMEALAHGGDPNLNITGEVANTSLLAFAASIGRCDISAFLFLNNADVLIGPEGPIEAAKKNGHEDIAIYLQNKAAIHSPSLLSSSSSSSMPDTPTVGNVDAKKDPASTSRRPSLGGLASFFSYSRSPSATATSDVTDTSSPPPIRRNSLASVLSDIPPPTSIAEPPL